MVIHLVLVLVTDWDPRSPVVTLYRGRMSRHRHAMHVPTTGGWTAQRNRHTWVSQSQIVLKIELQHRVQNVSRRLKPSHPSAIVPSLVFHTL